MRINQDPRLPLVDSSANYNQRLSVRLYDLFRDLIKQLNQISEGSIEAVTNAYNAAPTTGTYSQGDKIWHSAPIEAGSVSSKYIIIGYVCVASGTPGTWREMRVLTGN